MLFSTAALALILLYLSKILSEENSLPIQDNSSETIASRMLGKDHKVDLEIVRWKATLQEGYFHENSAIFADSLAARYMEYSIYDSAAKYFEIAATIEPAELRIEKAGNAYFEAFSVSNEKELTIQLGQKAEQFYEKILTNNPSRLDLKVRLALVLISSQNPLDGVHLLREVLDVDPEDAQALYHLGLWAMQNENYDLAVKQFEDLIIINESHTKAHFYLGICFKARGLNEKAREQFEIVKRQDPDPEVAATVDSFLDDLK